LNGPRILGLRSLITPFNAQGIVDSTRNTRPQCPLRRGAPPLQRLWVTGGEMTEATPNELAWFCARFRVPSIAPTTTRPLCSSAEVARQFAVAPCLPGERGGRWATCAGASCQGDRPRPDRPWLPALYGGEPFCCLLRCFCSPRLARFLRATSPGPEKRSGLSPRPRRRASRWLPPAGGPRPNWLSRPAPTTRRGNV
jgi:hypothetical protein